MKFITALLTTLVLASPALTFAAEGRIMHMPSKAESQDQTGMTRAVQYGKGTGMTRNDRSLQGNAFRSQTAADNGTVKATPNSTQSI